MVDAIVTKAHPLQKGQSDAYRTAQESLRAKLQQARAITETVLAAGAISARDWFHLTWCLSELLIAACEECERLQ